MLDDTLQRCIRGNYVENPCINSYTDSLPHVDGARSPAESLVSTGAGHTRLDLTQGGQSPVKALLHWLRCTGEASADAIQQLLAVAFHGTRDCWVFDEDAGRSVGRGARIYDSLWRGQLGECLYLTPVGNDRFEYCLDLPGKRLETLTPTSQAGLIRQLERHFGAQRWSRIDGALDDFSGAIALDDLEAAAASDNYKGPRQSGGDDRKRLKQVRQRTVTFGSRQSQTYIRGYRTAEKHDHDALRLEVEFKGAKANELGHRLASICPGDYDSPEDYRQAVFDAYAGHIIGAIDFIDRSKETSSGSLRYCPRLEWWQAFCDLVGSVALGIYPAKKVITLTEQIDYLERQFSGTLAVLRKTLGREKLDILVRKLCTIGDRKLTADHLARAATFAAELAEGVTIWGVT